MKNITPLISFRAVCVSVNLGMTHEGGRQRTIVLGLKFEDGEDVKTIERRSLKNAEWSIKLLEGSEFNAHAAEEKAIGFLSYYPESRSDYDYSSESCFASAVIEPITFSSLWALVSSGRLPDWLSITVKDMTYGYDPDGKEKVWDVTKTRGVAITEVSIRIPVAGVPLQTPEPGNDLDSAQANLPATSANIWAIAKQVTVSLGELQTQVIRQLRYLVGIAVFIAIYIFFK